MDEIEKLLTRGVDSIYPNKGALEKVLRSGKKLRLYQGFDPTGTQLHIGHAVAIRKLREFQDLGHEVIFLIGDGTGQAGDPSGKKSAREKFYNREELRANAADYVRQAGKIVRFDGANPVKILYNGDWLNKLGLVEILDIAGHFSLQQMLERDLYQDRLKSGVTLSLREFLYPLLQGYDSVAMKVDLELGGTDQTFNMLAGRTLVKAMLGREKFVMTVPLLTDAKGVKIGKTEGNVIGITDPPNELYAKIMNLGDSAIVPCFMLLTDVSEDKIKAMSAAMKKGDNPMTFKKQLALELVGGLANKKDAEEAQKQFELRSQGGNLLSASLPTLAVKTVSPKTTLLDFIVETSLAASKSDARRLIEQNAVEYNGTILTNAKASVVPHAGDIIKVGKKKYLKLV